MEKAEVYGYLADIKNANGDALLEKFGSAIEPKRIERINACTNPKEKTKLICTGTLLQGVLRRFGVTPDMIEYAEHDKPVVKGRDDIFFNVSHSGNFVFICVSGQNIGIDIQKPVPFKETLVNQITSMEERSSEDLDVVKHLNQIWAIKESYTKLTGEGIGKKLTEVTYKKADDHITVFDNGEEAAFSKVVYADDFYEAVVTTKEPFEMKEFAKMSL